MHELLVCPNCQKSLAMLDETLNCAVCEISFPIFKGIPILLPSDSVVSVEQVLASQNTYYATAANEEKNAKTKRSFRKSLPRITKSWERENFYKLINSELDTIKNPVGLQLGAGEVPTIIENKIRNVEWIHSDVDLAFKPDVIADAAGIPLTDNSVDIVFADNVLEHVFNLPKAASEIQRVVKIGGLVCVGIPFLYPFHGVPYDFTRLTPCGVRAAFRQTEKLFLTRDSGAFVALALQLDARLINLFGNRTMRGAATVTSRLLFGGLKHLDRVFTSERYISTAAALLYVGRKTEKELKPLEIMAELQYLFKTR